MARDNFSDLLAFITVVREQNFTRAAAQLGITQSALSQSMQLLESRLGVKLLNRTTRNVSPTSLGERLLERIGPQFEEIDNEINYVKEFRDKPAGTIRISVTDYAIESVLLPKLSGFLPNYPDISVEFVNDYGLTDIVARRCDAGVRLGEQVAKDMIAVRIGSDFKFAAVAAPSYFKSRRQPQTPHDLINHTCINLRLPTHGALYAWEFEEHGKEIKARVEGQVIFNGIFQVLSAAIAGLGIAYVPESLVEEHVQSGALVPILEAFCPMWPGYHLYYPNRRQPSRAMALFIEALREQPLVSS